MANGPLWHPFGRLLGPLWLAFSAFERLEPQREPFQPQFYDLVLFLVLFRNNLVLFLRFLTELLKVVWFLLCILFLLHVPHLILVLLPFLLLACSLACLLAIWGVRAQRSGARPLLAGCLHGCLEGWMAGWIAVDVLLERHENVAPRTA